jgi:hypothetical protein
MNSRLTLASLVVLFTTVICPLCFTINIDVINKNVSQALLPWKQIALGVLIVLMSLSAMFNQEV